jgi:zinc finger CCHC domain-containing protein 9
MTRITNIGRKRTYLEAGFGNADVSEKEKESRAGVDSEPEGERESASKTPRKRRRKKAKVATHDEGSVGAEGGGAIVKRDNQGATKRAETGEKRKRKDQDSKGERCPARL